MGTSKPSPSRLRCYRESTRDCKQEIAITKYVKIETSKKAYSLLLSAGLHSVSSYTAGLATTWNLISGGASVSEAVGTPLCAEKRTPKSRGMVAEYAVLSITPTFTCGSWTSMRCEWAWEILNQQYILGFIST